MKPFSEKAQQWGGGESGVKGVRRLEGGGPGARAVKWGPQGNSRGQKKKGGPGKIGPEGGGEILSSGKVSS